jgi:NitT/TauT family transport system substrate-binding protein
MDRNRRRREFVKGLGALAGSAAFLGYDLRCANAEPPPETTKLRLFHSNPTCLAPQYVAEVFLQGEGFTDVRYVNWPRDTQLWSPQNLLSGEVDIALTFIPQDLIQIDAGQPVVVLGGIHNGCRYRRDGW